MTKDEFFQFDYVLVTTEEVIFFKDSVTLIEKFIPRPESIPATLKFLEEAKQQGWIILSNWRHGDRVCFKITNPDNRACPMCKSIMVQAGMILKCLNCGHKQDNIICE